MPIHIGAPPPLCAPPVKNLAPQAIPTHEAQLQPPIRADQMGPASLVTTAELTEGQRWGQGGLLRDPGGEARPAPSWPHPSSCPRSRKEMVLGGPCLLL